MVATITRLWQATVGRSQFLRFFIVGGIGFVVDAGVLMGLVRGLALDPYSARVASFLAASSTTWYLNRIFTFRSDAHHHPVARQWATFVLVSVGGALINYGIYVATLQLWPLARMWPVIGVALGSLGGMGFNFPMSKLVVFRPSSSASAGKNP
jgi:putative flippase GtrA